MATKTGIETIDQVIAAFVAADPRVGLRPLSSLPEHSMGNCRVASEAFASFAVQRGLVARPSDWISSWSLDYHEADRPEARPRGSTHQVALVEHGGCLYSIDFAAAQYGYSEFPLVQKQSSDKWSRVW